MITDDELSKRLHVERDRTPDALSDDGVRNVARAMSATRRAGRRPLVALGVGLAVAAGAASAPAAAGGFRDWLAQTGIYCDGGSECRPGSELIDASADDIEEYISAQYPSYLTLPPGMTQTEAMLIVQARHPKQEGTLIDSDVFVASYEHVAYCGWVAEWLRADKEGELGPREAAGEALTEILDWPGPMQTSPDQELIAQREGFAKAAREGNRGGVQAAALHNACPAEDNE